MVTFNYHKLHIFDRNTNTARQKLLLTFILIYHILQKHFKDYCFVYLKSLNALRGTTPLVIGWNLDIPQSWRLYQNLVAMFAFIFSLWLQKIAILIVRIVLYNRVIKKESLSSDSKYKYRQELKHPFLLYKANKRR